MLPLLSSNTIYTYLSLELINHVSNQANILPEAAKKKKDQTKLSKNRPRHEPPENLASDITRPNFFGPESSEPPTTHPTAKTPIPSVFGAAITSNQGCNAPNCKTPVENAGKLGCGSATPSRHDHNMLDGMPTRF
ncbi:hypothetical protein OsJ_01744 [Oryza sativa Japonica Group]|jgi:hypothetical protein|uniref:Uncharacterized protein n=1 Tax=Oryza sativa subsp. japonica TaxID=39947 RepID=B9EWP9_ORYSJ|nr:hypothetical protein OsJ_01744 [Oryza sativa Japonica Group]